MYQAVTYIESYLVEHVVTPQVIVAGCSCKSNHYSHKLQK